MDTAKLFPHHNTMLDQSKRRVLSFGEGPEAFSELQITDTLCPISRGYIQLSGPDSRKFLQGQVTCDMQTVAGHQVLRGAHCTPKGRIIFLFSALCDSNDNILLETHSSVISQAIANLKKYAVFFKTEISDVSASLTTFLISGPSSAKSIATLCHQPLPKPGMHVEEADIWLRCIAENHYSVTCKSEDSARLIAAYPGLTLCGEAYADLITLRSGFADVTEDTLDKFIPQMLNLDRQAFINFQKGCYTGQEIIARAHYRGAVKRRLRHIQCPLDELPKPGETLADCNGKGIGSVASAAWSSLQRAELLVVISDGIESLSGLQINAQTGIDAETLVLPYPPLAQK